MSSFYRRYYMIVEKKIDSLDSQTTGKHTNGLYCPEFIDYLLVQFLAYCPLWTAMLMDLIDPEISRLSNVYAESHMKNYKYDVLMNKRNWPIGKVCRLLRDNNKALVLENALSKVEMKSKLKDSHYDLYRKTEAHSLDALIWDRKTVNDDIQSKKVRKRKTRHMAGKKLQHLTETEEETKKKKMPKIKTAGGRRNKKRKRYAANDLSVDDLNHKELQFLKNGLVNDVSYYANTKSENIIIAYYYPTTENFIIRKEMTLSGKQLRSILYRNKSLDAETIDIFAAMNIDQWNNICYLSTDLSYTVMMSNKSNFTIADKIHYKIKSTLGKTILMSYCEESHWMLIVINVSEKFIEILDTYDRQNNSTKILKALARYINKCDYESSFKKLEIQNWEVKDPRVRSLQKLTDRFNSTIYVMYYIQCIGQKAEMNQHFDPQTFRENIIHNIMLHSFNLADKCLYCFENIETEINIDCNMCQRSLHLNCQEYDELDTEDEEKLENNEFNTGDKEKLKKN